jgi:purine-binding chemotaxis protein CheW
MYNDRQSEVVKFILFKVSSYWYVVPAITILKIVNCPAPSEGEIKGLGIVQLGPHTIQLLDLNQILDHPSNHISSEEASFLLVFKGQENQFFGITLSTPPDLIDLPLNTLTSVSSEKKFTSQNPWISHVGVITIGNDKRTLLQLDLGKISQQRLEEPSPSTIS